jgi:RNA polymerase sigma-70 factor (ECF subfamily)
MTADHATLLALIAAGDEDALHQLYVAYRPRLRPYLWHQLGGDAQAVEETFQDIFLAVWRTAGAYRGEAKVASWIFQIAHYLVIHKRRTLARYANDVSADELDAEDASQAIWLGNSPEEEIVGRLALGEALRRLSPKHREVLDLVSRQGFSLEETAHILDVPTGTVKSRLNYARKALVRELSSHSLESLEGIRHDA